MTLTPQEKRTKQSYDKLATSWVAQHNDKDAWKDEMARFHKLLPTGTILEVGSGGARDARLLVELGYGYVGSDVSTGLLEVARKTMPGYEFAEQSVYDLNFPGREQFDGFWASAVLLHIPKKRIDEALSRIRAVVKPGAIGFISIKDGDREETETQTVDGKSLERFFAYWSKKDFEQVLKKNEYSILDYSYRPMSARTKWHAFLVKAG